MAAADLPDVAQRIVIARGQRVLLDSDLAVLYGVTPKRLNEQVRRNQNRFPGDFMFSLEINEVRNLRSQIATLSGVWGRHRKYPYLAFTEHGAIMAASVLGSPRAVEMSVYVVRAFVKLRQLLASNADLARKLEELEQSVASLDVRTKKRFAELYAAIRALMTPVVPDSRPIGFMADLDEKR